MQIPHELKEVVEKFVDIIAVNEKDLFLIYSDDIKKVKEKIKHLNKKYNLSYIKYVEILETPELVSLLYKGFSIKHNKFLYQKNNIIPKVIITYSLKRLNHSQKTMFGYALKGRQNETGILKKCKGNVLGRNGLIIPKKHYNEIKDFFDFWKVDYEIKEIIELNKNLNINKKD